MNLDPPATLDEPDTDCEVIAKLRKRVAELQAECGYKESIQALEIERLTAALTECAAPFDTGPTTIQGAAQLVAAEFQRRMEVAGLALEQSARTK